jgi:hypothetical protein
VGDIHVARRRMVTRTISGLADAVMNTSIVV